MDKQAIIQQMLVELGDKVDRREVLFAKEPIKPNMREKTYPVGTMLVVIDRPDTTYWLVKTVLDDMTFTVANDRVYSPEQWFESENYRNQMYLMYCLAVRFHRAWVPKTTTPGVPEEIWQCWRENGFIDEKLIEREKSYRFTTIALSTVIVVFAESLPSIMGVAHVVEATGELAGYSFEIVEDEDALEEQSPLKTFHDETLNSTFIHDGEDELTAENINYDDTYFVRVDENNGACFTSQAFDVDLHRWFTPGDAMRAALFLLRAAQIAKPLWEAHLAKTMETLTPDAEGDANDGIPY
jgi:hypothetical protein